MSKKIVHVEKKRGGCLRIFLGFIVVCVAIYAIAMAACIAAGVGLWFLARYIWRKLVAERPDSKIVCLGLCLPPIGRKVAAAVPCVVMSLCLIGALGSSTAKTKQNDSAGSTAGIEQAQSRDDFKKESVSSTTTEEKASEEAKPTAANVPTVSLDLASVPAYSGSPYVEVFDNAPQFTDADKGRKSFEEYSDLDSLGRCGVAFALVGVETMPTESRGSIGSIEPSGWHTVRYDGLVDGNYLYNRCHLIAYQLAGENDNEKNLITGTRYLNTEGMQPFEDKVAAYVQSTGNHVLLRVTPIYEGDNLVASGVQMEALSVEDSGAGVSFDVYCYNVQPGVDINYATGESALAQTAVAEANAEQDVPETNEANADEAADDSEADASTEAKEQSYVLNTNTKKFHTPGCSSVRKMADHNREDFTGTRDEVIARGYTPCQKCHP